MPNTQYTARPMTDWSSEIRGGPAVPAMATANSSTTTTTTTSSSASSAGHAAQAPVTATQTTAQDPGYPAAGQGGGYPAQNYPAPSAPPPASYPMSYPAHEETPAAPAPLPARNEFEGSVGTLDLQTHQPIEVVEAPATMNEAFLGSLKSMLLRNRGNFVTATFLIGTQGTTAWEGILHDVGNDYVIIYQPGRERYIACDIYSLKYIEFYDTRRRDMCESLLRQNGMRNNY